MFIRGGESPPCRRIQSRATNEKTSAVPHTAEWAAGDRTALGREEMPHMGPSQPQTRSRGPLGSMGDPQTQPTSQSTARPSPAPPFPSLCTTAEARAAPGSQGGRPGGACGQAGKPGNSAGNCGRLNTITSLRTGCEAAGKALRLAQKPILGGRSRTQQQRETVHEDSHRAEVPFPRTQVDVRARGGTRKCWEKPSCGEPRLGVGSGRDGARAVPRLCPPGPPQGACDGNSEASGSPGPSAWAVSTGEAWGRAPARQDRHSAPCSQWQESTGLLLRAQLASPPPEVTRATDSPQPPSRPGIQTESCVFLSETHTINGMASPRPASAQDLLLCTTVDPTGPQ